VAQNQELVRFVQALIHFRRQQPTVRREIFLTGRAPRDGALPDVSWFSALGTAVDWAADDDAMIALLTAPLPEEDPEGLGRDVMLLVNGTGDSREFILPPVAKGTRWRMFFNTGNPPPHDIYPEQDGPPPPESQRLVLPHRAMCCYVARKPE
jgi:isoamylase